MKKVFLLCFFGMFFSATVSHAQRQQPYQELNAILYQALYDYEASEAYRREEVRPGSAKILLVHRNGIEYVALVEGPHRLVVGRNERTQVYDLRFSIANDPQHISPQSFIRILKEALAAFRTKHEKDSTISRYFFKPPTEPTVSIFGLENGLLFRFRVFGEEWIEGGGWYVLQVLGSDESEITEWGTGVVSQNVKRVLFDALSTYWAVHQDDKNITVIGLGISRGSRKKRSGVELRYDVYRQDGAAQSARDALKVVTLFDGDNELTITYDPVAGPNTDPFGIRFNTREVAEPSVTSFASTLARILKWYISANSQDKAVTDYLRTVGTNGGVWVGDKASDTFQLFLDLQKQTARIPGTTTSTYTFPYQLQVSKAVCGQWVAIGDSLDLDTLESLSPLGPAQTAADRVATVLLDPATRTELDGIIELVDLERRIEALGKPMTSEGFLFMALYRYWQSGALEELKGVKLGFQKLEGSAVLVQLSEGTDRQLGVMCDLSGETPSFQIGHFYYPGGKRPSSEKITFEDALWLAMLDYYNSVRQVQKNRWRFIIHLDRPRRILLLGEESSWALVIGERGSTVTILTRSDESFLTHLGGNTEPLVVEGPTDAATSWNDTRLAEEMAQVLTLGLERGFRRGRGAAALEHVLSQATAIRNDRMLIRALQVLEPIDGRITVDSVLSVLRDHVPRILGRRPF
ncbi:MAG: hypothetical protein HY390_01410 [Deltaproteobacteria bacterium]|nr:hypothetical protein [Deltaproteobacteria bacterium]